MAREGEGNLCYQYNMMMMMITSRYPKTKGQIKQEKKAFLSLKKNKHWYKYKIIIFLFIFTDWFFYLILCLQERSYSILFV